MSSSTPSRGWFEGTLDVISGIAQRPSTPTPQYRHNGGTMSAPNSPMNRERSNSLSNNNNNSNMMTLHRLPSQDSLDRSIHNDSGHGNKSTAQIIRDLKQSNARLTARTAALEADFMNQLNEVTRQYEDKQQKLEEMLLKSEKLTSSLEHRCQVAEAKSKETAESLTRLREESAFQRHTISDLRTQLDWAESKDAAADWQEEKQTLLREVALLQEDAKAELREREQLQEQVSALRGGAVGGGDDDSALAETLRETQATLEQVRQEGQQQQVEHEKQVLYWKDQLDKVQQTTPYEYNTEEKKQADESSSSLPPLRQQLDETKLALEASRKELAKVKAQAQHEEQYRREEADDLRLLNDAQEEELERLRKDLDEAVKELEMRDQELEETRNQDLRERQEDEMVMEESSMYLSKIQASLEESKQNFEKLEKEFTETKQAKEGEIQDLSGRIELLVTDNERLQKMLDSRNSNGDENSVMTLRAKSLAIEEKNAELERSLRDMKTKLEEIERFSSDPMEAQEKIESDYQAQLVSKETEVIKLTEQLSTALNNAEGDKARIAELTDESFTMKEELEEANQKLKKAEVDPTHQQSGGEYEEDLRKEVSSLRQTRKELRAKIEALEDELESSQGSLRNKLADRDTTISALVKSNVSLEQEVSSAKIELQLFRARLSRSRDNIDEEEGVDVILARNEEVADLRDSLSAYKETESRMSQEVSRLEKQLSEMKWENIRLRRQKPLDTSSVMDDGSTVGSVTSSAAPFQIKERDEAIARLVKQTVSQDKEIQSLQSKVEKLNKELEAQPPLSPKSSPTEAEVEQLRQESEMFAGQVIELDEEIENLRCALDERNTNAERLEKELEELKNNRGDDSLVKEKDDKIAFLLNEVYDLKSRPMADGEELSKIRTLEAEVDELREAYDEQMNEVRTLRRTARSAKESSDEIAKAKAATVEAQSKVDELRKIIDTLSSETNTLEKELEDAKTSSSGAKAVEEQLKNLREEIADRDRQIEELKYRNGRRSPVPSPDEDEFEVESMKEEVMRLRRSMESQSADLDNAKQTIRELERMVAEKNEDAMAHWDEEKEELMADIEDLTRQLEEARGALASLEKEKNLIDDFKLKLEQADEERENSVKLVTDTYERKLSLLTLDKDVTIDKLRKELVAAKEGSTANVDDLQAEIEEYRAKLDDIGEQATAEIEQRDSRIFALENTLEASKQLVSNMRTEMDHLQGSMVNAVAGRKEEIEDMQQELVDLTATTARQDRELGALRMKLEEKHLAHQAEVARLHETITKLEGEKAQYEGHRNAHDLQMDLRVREVKERLEKLKWRNTSLQEENESLRQRLAKLEANSKAEFVERERYEKLQMQFSTQKKEIQKLQAELEEARSVVVTAPPTLSPSSAEKVKGKNSRRGFLGRRRGTADEGV